MSGQGEASGVVLAECVGSGVGLLALWKMPLLWMYLRPRAAFCAI